MAKMTTGLFVKALREAEGLSQQQLARRAGIPKGHIVAIETPPRKRKGGSLKYGPDWTPAKVGLRKVAKVLGVPREILANMPEYEKHATTRLLRTLLMEILEVRKKLRKKPKRRK